MNESTNDKNKDPVFLRHWKSWGSWYSWGSPVGIGIAWFLFMVGTGLGLFLIRHSEVLSQMAK